jgi:hypothetical protein
MKKYGSLSVIFVSFSYCEKNRQARLSIYLWHGWFGEPDISTLRPTNAGESDRGDEIIQILPLSDPKMDV